MKHNKVEIRDGSYVYRICKTCKCGHWVLKDVKGDKKP